MKWNANLRNRFVDCITKPFKHVNDEDTHAKPMQCRSIFRYLLNIHIDANKSFYKFIFLVSETMRVEEISKTNLPTEELSEFGKTDFAIVTEPVDNVNILPVTNIIHESAEASMAPEMVPEVADTVTLGESIR